MIAVIDDDPTALRALGRLLPLHGFCASLYASAEEFLAEPLARAASLVLVDLHLGNGMSGIELARSVRALGDEPPIVLMSANFRSLLHAQSQHIAGVVVLEKPFSTELLLEIIAVSLLS